MEKSLITVAALDAGLLLGVWQTTNQLSTDIVQVAFRESECGLKIRIYGACQPEPCDWGEADVRLFANDPESRAGMAIEASFDFGFMDVEIQGYVVHGVLVIVSFTRFRDDSGRSNYLSKEFFYRRQA